MPEDFATVAHNVVVAQMSPFQPRNPDIFSELVGGWKAVAIRFKTATKADERFTVSIRSATASASFEEREIQEEALFAFFVNGYAAIESYVYAAFAMGAMLLPADFPMATPKDLKAINPRQTQRCFTKRFPGTRIEAKLTALLADPSFERWGLVRNVLAHRSTPARHHHLNVGDERPDKTEWEVMGGIILDTQTTASRRPWLASTLTECVEAAAVFATADFPVR